MNKLQEFELQLEYQQGVLDGRTSTDMYNSCAKPRKYQRSKADAMYTSMKNDLNDKTGLGPFGLSLLRLKFSEEKFRHALTLAAYSVQLENPRDLRDHEDDVKRIMEGEDGAWRSACGEMLDKLDELEIDTKDLRALYDEIKDVSSDELP